MNEAIHLSFDDGRFEKSQNRIRCWREEVQMAGAKIIRLTPSVFDEAGGGHPGYSAVLDRYSEWLVGQRPAGWSVVDLHGPMKRELLRRRKSDPGFAFSKDGVQPNDSGHWVQGIAHSVVFRREGCGRGPKPSRCCREIRTLKKS